MCHAQVSTIVIYMSACQGTVCLAKICVGNLYMGIKGNIMVIYIYIYIYIYNKQIWGFEWDLLFENYI